MTRGAVTGRVGRRGGLRSSGGLGFLAATLLAVSLAPGTRADPVREPGGFLLRDAVLASVAEGVLHLTNPDGALEAIDAATGRLLWTAAGAGRPLARVGGRLLAQRAPETDGLWLVVLDAADGRRLHEPRVPLPPGVTAPLDLAGGDPLRLTPLVRHDAVWLLWAWEERWAAGRPPPPGAVRRTAHGAVRVDLATGQATSHPLEEAPRAPVPEAPAASPGLPEARLLGPPWPSEGLLVAPAVLSSAAGERRVLRRWTAPAGEALPDLPLPEGFQARLASGDGRLVLTSRYDGQGADGIIRYRWRIVDGRTGAVVHEGDHEAAATPFVALAGRLVLVAQPYARRTEEGMRGEPLRVVALDPASGATVWSRPVRDLVTGSGAPPGR